MGKPYKQAKQYLYTEVVFFDGYGNEVARERVHDDHLYDEGTIENLTDSEIEDYIP